MNPMTLGEFARRCAGELVSASSEIHFTGFALDSREVEPGQIFLAIKGQNQDGHDFVAQAFEAGAIAALVEQKVEGPHILVPSLTESLARFGLSKRLEFHGPVVGITGSNGKTTTKEFTAAALGALGPVLKSQGNRNTEYTAPLVWAELEPKSHQAVVVELAMRGFGQIAHLTRFTQPTIALITMIGTAHIEKVGSREGIAMAKSEVLKEMPTEGVALLWREDDFYPTLSALAPAQIHTFGFTQEADCQILGYRALSWDRSLILGQLDGVTFEAELPLLGRHQALNAAAAVLAAHTAGVEVHTAASRLCRAELPPMRMQFVRLPGGATALLDTYNASPDSMVAALIALAELPCTGRRLAVLGEMKELGDFEESGHRMVGKVLATSPLDKILTYGRPMKYAIDEALQAGFPEEKIERAGLIEDVTEFLKDLKEGDVVLIKGSRALGLEKALVQPTGVPS